MVTTAGTTPELDPVAGVAILADATVPVGEAPVFTTEPTEEVAAPNALTVPTVLGTPEDPLVDAPITATPVDEEAPAVEAPLRPPVKDELPDIVVAAADAGLVNEAPEFVEPDTEPVAVAGRLAVPVCDSTGVAVDTAEPAPVAEAVFKVPDSPVEPSVLLSPVTEGRIDPALPVDNDAVEDKTPDGPKTMLPVDGTLSDPDVEGRPIEAVGGRVLPLEETTPEGPKTMLEPEGAAVDTDDDTG